MQILYKPYTDLVHCLAICFTERIIENKVMHTRRGKPAVLSITSYSKRYAADGHHAMPTVPTESTSVYDVMHT